MAGQVVTDWRRQVVMYRQRREHFCQPENIEAGACQKTRQVFVGDLLINTKTVVSLCLHCSPLVSQPVTRVESDGLVGKAGDGTRTRDSLLGRLYDTGTRPASFRSASQAHCCHTTLP